MYSYRALAYTHVVFQQHYNHFLQIRYNYYAGYDTNKVKNNYFIETKHFKILNSLPLPTSFFSFYLKSDLRHYSDITGTDHCQLLNILKKKMISNF